MEAERSGGLGRWLWLAAAALTASLLLGAAPLAPGDPFRATLVMIPWVVAGLAVLGRWAAAHGWRGRSKRAATVELSLLGVLVLSVVARTHLGLGSSATVDALLAAGFLLLLARRLTVLVPALRPALGRRLPARPPWPFFVLPLLAYLAILPWSAAQRPPDGDEPYYLLIAHSLAYDFDTELTNNYREQDSLRFIPRALEPEWADPVGPEGASYSRHNMLFPLLLAPAYRLAGKWGALAMMALLTAAAAWMSLRVARHYWADRPGAVLIAWAVLALSPPLLIYSQQIWVEVPAALLMLTVLDGIYLLDEDGSGRRRQWLRVAIPLVLLPLLKLRFLLLAVSLLALAGWRLLRAGKASSRRAVVFLAVLLIGVAAGMLLYNELLFDRPFKDHTWAQLKLLQEQPPLEYVRGALGLLCDCAFGLFASAPIWLLVFPAVLLLARRRERLLRDLLVCSLPYLAVVSPRMEWYGAWSPPFRLGLVLLPLLALGLVPLLDGRRRGGAPALVAALASLTAVLTLLWLAVPAWTFNVADGSSHLLGYLNERLGADVGRLFPSFVRIRPATWVGSTALVAMALAVWRLPLRRRAARSWGLAALLVAVAVVPVAAARLPTRVVEFEDRQVRKSGGEVFPDSWVPARPRFRGGWILEPGDRLEAPVVAAGRRVSISIDVRTIRAGRVSTVLEVGASQQDVVRWPVEPASAWQRVSFELEEWPEGAPLVVRLAAAGDQPAASRLILDRATLEWRD